MLLCSGLVHQGAEEKKKRGKDERLFRETKKKKRQEGGLGERSKRFTDSLLLPPLLSSFTMENVVQKRIERNKGGIGTVRYTTAVISSH